MSLKMKELTALSGESKSTILYYIREGLLPEPEKPKPNVHLYDESFVERIKFIKYLQQHFNATIEQIKLLMKHNSFDLSGGFASILDTVELLMAPPTSRRYSDSELCEAAEIECDRLERYKKAGFLFDRGGGYSDKELEIVVTLKNLEKLGGEELAVNYLEHAKTLSRTEMDIGQQILEQAPAQSKNFATKSILDAIVLLKPYLMNMYLFETYRNNDQNQKEK